MIKDQSLKIDPSANTKMLMGNNQLRVPRQRGMYQSLCQNIWAWVLSSGIVLTGRFLHHREVLPERLCSHMGQSSLHDGEGP